MEAAELFHLKHLTPKPEPYLCRGVHNVRLHAGISISCFNVAWTQMGTSGLANVKVRGVKKTTLGCSERV